MIYYCNKCSKEFDKLEGNFYPNKGVKRGYNYSCIKCYNNFQLYCRIKREEKREKQLIINKKIADTIKMNKIITLTDEEAKKQAEIADRMAKNFTWQEKKHKSFRELTSYI